ncbi:MAG: hypothetical protein V4641_07490 [Pseudomonadota bacterium]|jgi:hypothetical protein
MKMLSRVDANVAVEINRQFPQLKQIRELDSDGGMQRLAISVFDHWLDDESEWHLLDCFEGEERVRRNQKFAQHWAALFDLTPVYTLRHRGRWPAKAKLVLKRYTDHEGFLRQSRFNDYGVPSQFIILPELGCIYAAGWDDTNILYFQNKEQAAPVLELATKAGLFCLNPNR